MDLKIGVVGLGYVGLPLAVEAGKKYHVIGYDVNNRRIKELNDNHDSTLEVDSTELKDAKYLSFSSSIKDLTDINFYIITVPTPVDEYKQPDLNPLLSASKAVGSVLSKGDIVVYESTVYPGCTEDDCIPVLEEYSGLKFNKDFFCGYSPERINPGDKKHRLVNTIKVTSGCNKKTADIVDDFYKSIISVGTHKASSIKVAEASKVIENAQRDINIAFINELSLIFNRLNIDTLEVLEAAGTKWNFLPFKPGLVGGHCIGVDPYYLTHKAEKVGYIPEIILSGRRINDNMGKFIAQRVLKLLVQKVNKLIGARILICGITFKENCPDIRNTRIVDIYEELKEYNVDVEIYDPHANAEEVKEEYGIEIISSFKPTNYDGYVMAVSHEDFKYINWQSIHDDGKVIYDVKGLLPLDVVDERL
ncbi:MAG TPA: nucleotide sugar dehydrogenase [Cyclobacteriaceae bacterium]